MLITLSYPAADKAPGTLGRPMRRTLAATLVALGLLAVPAGAGVTATLSNYSNSPDMLKVLEPGRTGGKFPCRATGEVAAFTDTGVRLRTGPRPGGRDGFTFAHPRGGYVVYDAAAKRFRNDTRRRVLVAAWCS